VGFIPKIFPRLLKAAHIPSIHSLGRLQLECFSHIPRHALDRGKCLNFSNQSDRHFWLSRSWHVESNPIYVGCLFNWGLPLGLFDLVGGFQRSGNYAKC